MDGVPALDLWDLIVTVPHGNTNQSELVRGNLSTSLTRTTIPGNIYDLNNRKYNKQRYCGQLPKYV